MTYLSHPAETGHQSTSRRARVPRAQDRTERRRRDAAAPKGPNMEQAVTRAKKIPAGAINALIADSLAKVGLPAADAARIAELMTEADLTGADAHGVFR